MKYLLLVFIFLICNTITGQQGQRYTEEEIAVQGLFIKATQKKLLGKLDDAVAIYEEILKKDKSNPVVYFDLSRIYLKQKDKELSLENAEKALKKDPTNQWYQESIAEIHFAFENYQNAGEHYERLGHIEGEEKYHFYRAQEAYEKARNGQAALMVLNQYETIFGPDSYSIEESTRLLLNRNKNKEALAKATELLFIYPGNTEYLSLNARLQSEFGSRDQAKKYYQQILNEEPENSEALVFMAGYTKQKDKLSVIEQYSALYSVDIDTKIKALIPFAEKLYEDSSNTERLLAIGRNLITLHPTEAKAHAFYADVLYSSGNFHDAENQYMLTLDLDKSVFSIWKQLMAIRYEMEKYEALKETSENALDYYPNQAYTYVYNGLACLEVEEYEAANEMLNEAILIGTNDSFLKLQIELLQAKIIAYKNGEMIVKMTGEELFTRGLKTNDKQVMRQIGHNLYLVRISASQKSGTP